MTLSRISLALTLGLTLASTPALAAAPGQQTTSFSDQQVATMLMQQQGNQAQIEADLKEARAILATAKKLAVSSPDPARQNVDLAPLTARVTALEGQLHDITVDIAGLKAAVAGKASQTDLEALARRVTSLEGRRSPAPYDDSALTARVEALEDAPPVVAHDTNTIVRTSGFGLIGYVGADVAITKSYVPVYGTASGRVVGGVRPAWDVGSGDTKFGLDLEANWTPVVGQGSGFGVRAVPTLVGSFDGLDLGFGLGPAYDCSVLTRDGCMAEHVGGLARGTVLIGGAFGVRLHGDLEVNYLTVSAEQPELRTVLGADFYIGRRHETYVQ